MSSRFDKERSGRFAKDTPSGHRPPAGEDNQTSSRIAARSARHPRVIIAVLSFGGLVASFMQILLVPVVGKLPEYLGTTTNTASWVITSTLLCAAVAMPLSGRLADMIGKRRVIVGCASTMTAGSVLCALTSDIAPMIVGRGMQGIAMGLIPCGISLMRDQLPADRVPTGIAVMSATLGVGGAVGLPASAWIVQNTDWHALFWLAATLGVICVSLTLKLLDETDIRSSGSFDIAGAIGLTVALCCLLVPLSKSTTWGWGDTRTLGGLMLAAALFIVWGWFETSRRHPLVDLRVARQRTLVLTNAASILVGFALMTVLFAVPQLVQAPRVPGLAAYGLGKSLVETGVILAPAGLAMMAVAPVSARLNISIGPRRTLIYGCWLASIGYACLIMPISQTWQVAIAIVVINSGVGMSYSSLPALVMSCTPTDQTSAANSLNALMRSIGSAAAAAITAAVLATSMIDIGHDSLLPAGSSFTLVFSIGAATSLGAAGLAALIPRQRSAETSTKLAPANTRKVKLGNNRTRATTPDR